MTVAKSFEKMDYGTAPESASAAISWLEERNRRIVPFINGQFLHGFSGKTFVTSNPATGEELADVAIFLLSLATMGGHDLGADVDAKLDKVAAREYVMLQTGELVKAAQR